MAREQSVIEKILEKLNFLERRSMNLNSKPHESCRQLMQIWTEFDPSGDPAWPLRQMRGVSLDYMRTLSMHYPKMDEQERHTFHNPEP